MAQASQRWTWVGLDVVVPGLGLMQRGRGHSQLIGPILAFLSVFGVAAMLSAPAWWPNGPLPLLACATWGSCLLGALVLRLQSPRPAEPAALREGFSLAAAAFLRNDYSAADLHAQRLCQLTPDDEGVWQLRALIARASGQSPDRFVKLARRCAAAP